MEQTLRHLTSKEGHPECPVWNELQISDFRDQSHLQSVDCICTIKRTSIFTTFQTPLNSMTLGNTFLKIYENIHYLISVDALETFFIKQIQRFISVIGNANKSQLHALYIEQTPFKFSQETLGRCTQWFEYETT